MSDVYAYHEGTTPLLVSVPHDGWQIPDDILQQLSGVGRGIPDTDWHVNELYAFAKDLGASMISANISRYVVDLNRPADDAALYAGQLATGLCPTQTFSGEDLYLDDVSIDVEQRVKRYWRPYHEKLAQEREQIRKRHGYALIWDAHSIASQVPRLFEGELPVLNLGTWDDRSCDKAIGAEVMQAANDAPESAVLNGRFKGGYITRHYGQPHKNVHAIQLELAQRAYMNEATLEYDNSKALNLRATLERLLETFLSAALRGENE